MSTKRILARDLKIGDQSGNDMVYGVVVNHHVDTVRVTWRDTVEVFDISEEVDILDDEPETTGTWGDALPEPEDRRHIWKYEVSSDLTDLGYEEWLARQPVEPKLVRVYIDKVTGTWGDADDIVVLDADPDALANMSDNDLIDFATNDAAVVEAGLTSVRLGRTVDPFTIEPLPQSVTVRLHYRDHSEVEGIYVGQVDGDGDIHITSGPGFHLMLTPEQQDADEWPVWYEVLS